MAYMEKTGALARIIVFIKTIACGNRAVQIMMINIGFGTLMVAVGATPVSLLPPILVAMGYFYGYLWREIKQYISGIGWIVLRSTSRS